MASVQELLRSASVLPGEDGRRDAETLLGHCLGRSRSWLYTWPEADVAVEQADRYRNLLARRLAGCPVAYLTGVREFWSMQLAVDEHTLIPRPETEVLVEWALDLPLSETAAVADLGTGTGAIALAVARERRGWHVTAVDRSAAALETAAINARRNGLDRVVFMQSDWFSALRGRRFDLLLANPPYVAPDDEHLQRGDLRFEPLEALVAGQGGLAALALLAAGAPDYLHPGGRLLLEHGCEQGAAVRKLLQDSGFCEVVTRRDLAGLERVSGGCWHAE
jgi:release factor glutamine methyltransferase